MIRLFAGMGIAMSIITATATPFLQERVKAEQHPESVEQIIDRVSDEEGFNRGVLRAIALQESGGYESTNRVKYEPHLLEYRRGKDGKVRAAIVPPAGLNQIEKQLWASSHGILQIIFGFHYKLCGLPPNAWDKLHDPETNIRCGATILKSYLSRYQSVSNQRMRLWMALKDYNGSEQYADKVLTRIALLNNINLGKGI